MLDADFHRRSVAIAATGLIALYYLNPALVAVFLALCFMTDWVLGWALEHLIALPHSAHRLRLVQLAAFSAMSVFLFPVVVMWDHPASTARVAAILLIFGGMLSVMLVRSAFRPLTIANSLPLAGVVLILAYRERHNLPVAEHLTLGFGTLVLAAYFVTTLKTALAINTRLILARDEALARVATQKRFLATMSHELRTPLNAILGMAQTLVTRQPGIGAEVIRDNARDMADMVSDLLDSAAIEAGALRINRRPEDLAKFMARLADRWQPDFAAKGLTLRLMLAPDLPIAMMIDALRLSQCLSNLLGNALRLTSSGEVVLELLRHPKGLQAIVTDTGPGLPQGAEARLFQPFVSVGDEDVRSAQGTGLGLSICRGLAVAMGGDLVFERPKQGGSRFRLSVAAQKADLDDARIVAPDVKSLLQGARVLLVDDIATNRLVLRLLLMDAGAEVTELSSGAAALRHLADAMHAQPDAVLMDIRMPELSGFETLTRLRAMGLTMPVVAVSADAAPAERAEAIAQGFDGYLTKPVEASALQGLLAQVLAGKSVRL